jgi:thymidylate synthase
MQYFINDNEDGTERIDCIVNFRSNDAVFGFNNDALWAKYVLEKLSCDLSNKLNRTINVGNIWWNAGSLHIYERHFKFLE